MLPPAIYRCNVFVDEEVASNGLLVEAYVDEETYCRPGACGIVTDGVAIIQVPLLTSEDIGKPIWFYCGKALADETPDVDISYAALEVELNFKAQDKKLVLEFPYGIEEDNAAVNFKKFEGETVDLYQVGDTIPEQILVIHFYGGPDVGWLFYRPGWSESTLDHLEDGEIYIFIVLEPCTWEIPQ